MLLRCFLLFFLSIQCVFSSESFILLRFSDAKELISFGPNLDERLTPASTFKIPLSLIGYDVGVLHDETAPLWPYKPHYEAYIQECKAPTGPLRWMQYSVVWYSKLLAKEVGENCINSYLKAFGYGNGDTSSGLGSLYGDNPFWIKGSLAISLREQADFLLKMLQAKLPVSSQSFEKTRAILFKEELSPSMRLFGKTGYSGALASGIAHAYFVGWLEKGDEKYIFTYLNSDQAPILSQRIPRVKELLKEAGI